MIKYLFADRDGTLIVDKHYLSDPAQVELFPGVAKALKLLQNNGIKTLVVTNQSGIGRGYFSEQDFLACQQALAKLLRLENAELLDYAFCPHAPEDACICRKPSLGMWEYLSQKHGILPCECAMKFSGEVFGLKQEKTKCYLASTLSTFSHFLIENNG